MTRVLIVEDERPLLRALAMNVTACGYDVTEADSGAKALAAAATGSHDVILLDGRRDLAAHWHSAAAGDDAVVGQGQEMIGLIAPAVAA